MWHVPSALRWDHVPRRGHGDAGGQDPAHLRSEGMKPLARAGTRSGAPDAPLRRASADCPWPLVADQDHAVAVGRAPMPRIGRLSVSWTTRLGARRAASASDTGRSSASGVRAEGRTTARFSKRFGHARRPPQAHRRSGGALRPTTPQAGCPVIAHVEKGREQVFAEARPPERCGPLSSPGRNADLCAASCGRAPAENGSTGRGVRFSASWPTQD